MSGAGAVVLVAHGSRHPKAALTTHALARAVSAARPGLDVHTAYLDHAGPRPGAVLAELDAAGVPSATVVPLLLTSAYHGKVDLPAALASAREEGVRLPVRRTDVLGPVAGQVPPALLAGLRRRLDELGVDYDAVALLAAGTRDTAARRTVHEAAAALGAALGVACRAGFASGPGPRVEEVTPALRAAGARRVVCAAYFLATGVLYQSAAAAARAVGAVAVAEPLGAAPELARLILARVDAAAAQSPL